MVKNSVDKNKGHACRPVSPNQRRGKQAGFTLIELLVVVVIIGVLSALLMSNFVGIRQRARDGQRKADLRQIQSALELYRSDVGQYPPEDEFPSITDDGNCGENIAFIYGTTTYMRSLPCDPLNTGVSYYYASSNGATYTLAACLENTQDADGVSNFNPGGGWTCASGVNFVVYNP